MDYFSINIDVLCCFAEVHLQFLLDLCYVEVTVCLNILQRILQQYATVEINTSGCCHNGEK